MVKETTCSPTSPVITTDALVPGFPVVVVPAVSLPPSVATAALASAASAASSARIVRAVTAAIEASLVASPLPPEPR